MDITVDGISAYYKITGEGPKAAVILQGWGTRCELYDPLARDLLPDYRVVQLDLPGFGASQEPEEAWDVSRYGDWFLHFLEALHLTEVTLLAHSYGGRVVLSIASRGLSSPRIDRIVLIDSAGILPVRTPKQKRRVRRYKALKKITSFPLFYALFPDLIDAWRGRQGSEDYRNATPIMRKALVMAVNDDQTDLLPLVKAPVLLIWGDQDTATPIRDAHIMEEGLPDAGLCILEGTGHFSFLQKPAEFRAILRSFLCGDEKGGRP